MSDIETCDRAGCECHGGLAVHAKPLNAPKMVPMKMRRQTTPGVREEFLEQALALILKESMIEAKGDQTLGVALALKRAYITGFKTGQACPAPRH